MPSILSPEPAISYCDDLDFFKDFKNESPAIVYNDAQMYEGLEYSDTDITNFEARLARIHKREVHKVQIFDFGGLSDLMAEELTTAGFGTYWAESARQVPNKGDLRDYWMGISSDGDFLGTTLSYTVIWDPILRLCHRLIASSIAGRSQASEKVTVMDLFYLRGMDVESVNVPYLLARYLRLFIAEKKSRAHISGGQFRQPDAAAGAPVIAEDAPAINEGDQAVRAPMQAP
ncbi:hypothetical protein Tco_0580499 [Tanacetum coccineum]